MFSADDFGDDLAMIENRHGAVLTIAEVRFRVDTNGMIDRGGDIGGAEELCGRIGGLFVAGSDDLADFRAGTGEEERAASSPVVSAATFVDLRGPAEFGEKHDQRVVEQPALLEIADERGERLIHAGDVIATHRHLADVRKLLLGDVVVVPQVSVVRVIAVIDHDESRARFNESRGHQTTATDLCAAVGIANGIRLFADVEGIANLAGGQQAESARKISVDRIRQTFLIDGSLGLIKAVSQ